MISLKSTAERALAIALLAVVGIILVAGLWPFRFFPANNVAWLKDRNGLEFRRNSVVLSRAPLDFAGPRWSSISIEIWLRPTVASQANTFLSIYTPENPKQFCMTFYHNLFLLTRSKRDTKGGWADTTIGADDVVSPSAPIFITITSGSSGSAMYFNGQLARVFPGYLLSGRDLSGQLIFGTSPFEDHCWHGEWRGLAIYGEELSAAEVLAHYQQWTEDHQAALAQDSAPMALYDFHEGTGDTVHDLAGAASDLFIPKSYSVPHKAILQWPWNEYRPDPSYVADLAVNIAGFVPLGFFLTAFLLSNARSRMPVFTAIVIGALLSLTIELLQAYIPERFSGMTDIITNTLGTALGALLCGQQKVRAGLTRLGLETKFQNASASPRKYR
ncbi:MAG TPA: VanZ family protein [Candidatus Sulfotelmatobacter sp.]|nr:VanZ family protein [Candidatus Sulfotelmatobacter sp.]